MASEKKPHTDTPDGSLLLRYIDDLADRDERLFVEQWADQSAQNEKTLTKLALAHHADVSRRRIEERDTLFAMRKVERRIGFTVWRRRLRRTAVAASLLVGMAGIGSLFLGYFGSRESVPAMITVSSNDNSRTQISLPDGTEVHLNSASSLTYPSQYTDGERRVTLSGEAYFKVSRNEDMPFTVSTPDKTYNVRVLGTEFNMQAWEDSGVIQTSLVSGSVEVSANDGTASVMLEPSQKAVYAIATNELQVTETDIDRETDWMYGRLVFKKTPMPEVFARLARFYNIEFDIRNEIIDSYTFTGTFEDKPLFQVLEYMKISSGVEYSMAYRKEGDTTRSVVVMRK